MPICLTLLFDTFNINQPCNIVNKKGTNTAQKKHTWHNAKYLYNKEIKNQCAKTFILPYGYIY